MICKNPKLGLKGLIDIFSTFYRKYKPKIKIIPSLDNLITTIQDLAFNLEEGNKKPALELLKVLCGENKTYVTSSLAKFYTLIKEQRWRTDAAENWEIYIEDQRAKATGKAKFNGLNNPANSKRLSKFLVCYMNSVLQQLYMIPSFRKEILEIKAKTNEVNALYCVKWIFGNLRNGRRTYFDASVLCKHIKDLEGRCLSIYEQKDADEFFSLLMDKLELNLKATDRPELTKDTFGGAFANDVICEDCPHRSTVREEFLALNLQIHNKKNIAEGLKSFIEEEKLSGGNAYHCAKCDKRVNAKKRVSFGTLPNVLVIALKRFEFDFHRK